MIDLSQDISDVAPRRAFFRRFGGAMALGDAMGEIQNQRVF